MSKTRVAPLKRLSIPRLELCGVLLLSKILSHAQQKLEFSSCEIYAWTDSTVVLGWLNGDPRRFKTFVGNRVSQIISLVAPERWSHVTGSENPADCASRGLFPSELIDHALWWTGPAWLHQDPSHWPSHTHYPNSIVSSEEAEPEFVYLASTDQPAGLIDFERYSKYNYLKRVIAWMVRFVDNCKPGSTQNRGSLTTQELRKAELCLWLQAQSDDFLPEKCALQSGSSLSKESRLRTLHPYIEESGLLRVGGRVHNSNFSFSQRHPVILHGSHPLTKLLIHAEHVRLLHAGPTLVSSSLSRTLHIVGQKRAVRTVTRACVICRRTTAKPHNQLMGQLPVERVTPGIVFQQVGIDYAGPVRLRVGHVRRPTYVKAYIGVFVSFTIKAVHLELISDLTSASFIACLRRFIARRGKPHTIWSDHGSNFVGAERELTELANFLDEQQKKGEISDFCSSQMIQWTYIPERAPHFGGLWESAVKSVKTHLRRILGEAKLTFEEFSTVLCQVEACLNSQPLVPIDSDEDGIEALMPGHFLIGRPLEAIPDPLSTFKSKSVKRRWNLCQILTQHFWKRWSSDYFSSICKFTKWHTLSRNLKIGDVVLLSEDGMIPTKWPLGRVVATYSGRDNIVRVVSVKTATGTYKRPVAKVALLISE